MASTNHTDNYNLPQWEATDAFRREDFNEAFSKIDTAIAGAGAKIAIGFYTGNNAEERTFALDFTPVAVLVIATPKPLYDTNSMYGGLAITDHPAVVKKGSDKWGVRIVENGFQVSNTYYSIGGQNCYIYTNNSLYSFTYLAIA